MARHDQRPREAKFICTVCKAGACEDCVDIKRILLDMSRICDCTARGHKGEPRDQQVLDPETGVVHAPGLTVSIDGEVTRG